MENDIIYFSDFPNLQETGTRKDNGKFDLTLLPTQELKEEFRGYIMYRCKNGTFRALIQDRTAYNHIAKFLNSRINRRIKSLGDRNPEKWISLLKGWMLEQGITIVKEKKSVYGTVSYGEAVTILYFRNVLKFLGPEDLRDEIEKDVWELKNLDIKIRSNPIYNVKTLDFRKIYQPDIREECKKAVYMNLQYEAIGTVQGELTIMRIFSEYLQKEYSKIKSCSEIDREVLEEFLIHLSTKDTSHSANSSYVISLRRQLETSDAAGFASAAQAYYNTKTDEHILRICKSSEIPRYIVFHEFTHILDTEMYAKQDSWKYMALSGYTEYHAAQVELMIMLGADSIQTQDFSFTVDVEIGNSTVRNYLNSRHQLVVNMMNRTDFPRDIEALKTTVGVLYNYFGVRSICKMYAKDYTEEVDNTIIIQKLSKVLFEEINSFMVGWFNEAQVELSFVSYMKIMWPMLQSYFGKE